MTGTPNVLNRTWPVGDRTATLSVSRGVGAPIHARIEWSPSAPSRLTDEELRQYRVGRNQAFAELAAELGGTVAVIDL